MNKLSHHRWYILVDCPIANCWLCPSWVKTVCDTVFFCQLHFFILSTLLCFHFMISMFGSEILNIKATFLFIGQEPPLYFYLCLLVCVCVLSKGHLTYHKQLTTCHVSYIAPTFEIYTQKTNYCLSQQKWKCILLAIAIRGRPTSNL